MSADNGIYILETLGPEYRVNYHGAVENLEWDNEKNEMSSDPDVWIKNARQMWPGVMTTDRTEALVMADKTQIDYGWTEYGICFIKIDRKF